MMIHAMLVDTAEQEGAATGLEVGREEQEEERSNEVKQKQRRTLKRISVWRD